MPGVSTTVNPCLWFDGDAEEAAAFYTAIFPGSQVLQVMPRPEGVPGETGAALLVRFTIAGTEFWALNGGPGFPFTQAVSLVANCADQAELDRLWAALADGGREVQCGWLVDRFGLSWQVVPAEFGAMMADADAAQAARVMAAVMGMVKLDVAALRAAFRG
jgi:predicted 3-demethylubiquinone-9 3-methyltransferase (glyoxalase superfamily)